VAPTYTSAARSATLRPWAAVVFAALAWAAAASRVSFLATVRARRAVDLLGVRFADVLLRRALLLRAAGLRAVSFESLELWVVVGAFAGVVVVVSALCWSQPLR
jgi:hypothetical protein